MVGLPLKRAKMRPKPPFSTIGATCSKSAIKMLKSAKPHTGMTTVYTITLDPSGVRGCKPANQVRDVTRSAENEQYTPGIPGGRWVSTDVEATDRNHALRIGRAIHKTAWVRRMLHIA